jgi:hypothetical protein
MRVAAIMPCRGRAEQTVRNVQRLLATAGHGDWELWCVCDGDGEVYNALQANGIRTSVLESDGPHGYWQSLYRISSNTSAPLFVNLANDLIPGQHWLARAVAAYDDAFGDGDGMVGFNGDSHEVGHSCHFLISRGLLARYGGWPVWYSHNFGDTELCQRAIADRCYVKAPWALLFHDHPYFGGADDAVYAEGRATSDQDEQLYHERRRAGWPVIQ